MMRGRRDERGRDHLPTKVARMSGILCAVSLWIVMTLAGCGGGEGPPEPLPSVTEEIRARSRTMAEAIVREDLDGLMDFYSERYRGRDGESRDEVRWRSETGLRRVDVIRLDAIREAFRALASGDIRQDVTWWLETRDARTGRVVRGETRSVIVWTNESCDWRMVHSEEDLSFE